MLWGLLLGNLVDLDHVYYRIIGEFGWFESACSKFGENCSIGVYPLHSFTLAFVFLISSVLILHKNIKVKFIGWLAFGAFLNILLDYIHMIIGFGI